MIMNIMKLNITEILTYVSNHSSKNLNETDILKQDSIEKMYSTLIKFGRLKEIDELFKIETEDDQYEEFKSLCNKLADDEDNIANMYLPNKTPSIQGSST